MGPPSYMRFVVDRNAVMRRIHVTCRKTVAVFTEDKEKQQSAICEHKEAMFSVDILESCACACACACVGP